MIINIAVTPAKAPITCLNITFRFSIQKCFIFAFAGFAVVATSNTVTIIIGTGCVVALKVTEFVA